MLKPLRLLSDGNPDTGFVPSTLVAKEDFTTDNSLETISGFYQSEDERVSVGVWECAPCKETFDAYPVDEMMTVLAGTVTLTSPDGTAQTFTAGDTFFMPKGTACVWEITETLKKHYMIAL